MLDLLLRTAGILCLVNAGTYALFAIDKAKARSEAWRISERTLLLAALLGGSVGAKLAQHRLRHKTRKEPFRTRLNLIVALHVAAVATLFYPPVRVAALEGLDAIVGIAAEWPGATGTRGPMPRRFGPGS